MKRKLLSVFVDESGILNEPFQLSRYYMLTFVFHDQSLDITEIINDFDRELEFIGIPNLCFHAGPIIHANDEFSQMNWDCRRKIFSRMVGFSRKVPFWYHSITIDKKFIQTSKNIIEHLECQLTEFLDAQRANLDNFQTVKIYYDCGQKTITSFLHDFFEKRKDISVEFAQSVQPNKYKIFQIADLICTLHLIEMKIKSGIGMSKSEHRFFGGQKNFKHNYLNKIKQKEI